MAIVQVSKIQMRRGFESDIPGEPLTLSPLVYKPGLDIGEIGFAIDTGKLFVGHAPSIGHANYQRTTFPYQNIEVLTENSTGTISALFGLNNRDVGATGFYSATLDNNITSAQDVLVHRAGGTSTAFRFEGEVLAVIEYFVYGFGNAPLRQGSLRILTEADNDTPVVLDNYIRSAQVVAQTSAVADPDADPFMTFTVARAGSESDPHWRLKYTSAINTDTTLYFRVDRPIP